MKLLKNVRFLFIFLFPFLGLSGYVVFLQTELYESKTTVLIKDVKAGQSQADMLSAMMPTTSSNMQDSKLIEKYIYSIEMFEQINQEFALKVHYMSSNLDILERLYYKYLEIYNKRLIISYDELSRTLDITFLHTDPEKAREILAFITVQAEKKLNMYDKENGNKLLDYIKSQEKKNKGILVKSVETLLAYQNSHKTIDPSIDIKSKSGILSSLETRLVQKEIEYDNLKSYMNPQNVEVKRLRAEIVNLKKKRNDLRSQLSGVSEEELNEDLFEFEMLRSDVEFNRERYKQTLIQLDMAMIQSTQNAKNLVVITKPTLSTDYSHPDKIKNIITIFMVLFMIYGIISMIYAIIKDHRD
jgi:capsular polysaccharide transport system permease protein